MRDDPERQGKEFQAWLDLDRSFSDGSAFDTLPLRDLSAQLGTFMNRHVLPSAGESPGNSFTRLWDEASSKPVPLPTLHIGGWFDIFCPSTLSQYSMQLEHSKTGAAPAPRLIVGPWTHTNFSAGYPDVHFGLNAAGGMMNGLGDLSGLQTAWFDSVLKGEPERLRQVPPVLLYFMGENQWRGFEELPSPRSHRSWFLGADGTLQDTPGSGGSVGYDYDPLDPVPAAGGATMIHGVLPRGPGRAARRGGPRRRPDLYGRGVRGAGHPVRRGQRHVLRGLHRRGHGLRGAALPGHSGRHIPGHCRRHRPRLLAGQPCGHRAVGAGHAPSPIEPGRPYEYTVSLWQTACTFAPGERLRVQVTSSCHPRWDRNLNTGKLAYDSAETLVARQSILFGEGHPSRLTAGIL